MSMVLSNWIITPINGRLWKRPVSRWNNPTYPPSPYKDLDQPDSLLENFSQFWDDNFSRLTENTTYFPAPNLGSVLVSGPMGPRLFQEKSRWRWNIMNHLASSKVELPSPQSIQGVDWSTQSFWSLHKLPNSFGWPFSINNHSRRPLLPGWTGEL